MAMVVVQNLNVTRHRLLHDGWLKWRLSRSKLCTVYVVLFADIILLMQGRHDDHRLVLRCRSTTLVNGQEDTRILFSPIIRLRDLLIRDNAAGLHVITDIYSPLMQWLTIFIVPCILHIMSECGSPFPRLSA